MGIAVPIKKWGTERMTDKKKMQSRRTRMEVKDCEVIREGRSRNFMNKAKVAINVFTSLYMLLVVH